MKPLWRFENVKRKAINRTGSPYWSPDANPSFQLSTIFITKWVGIIVISFEKGATWVSLWVMFSLASLIVLGSWCPLFLWGDDSNNVLEDSKLFVIVCCSLWWPKTIDAYAKYWVANKAHFGKCKSCEYKFQIRDTRQL